MCQVTNKLPSTPDSEAHLRYPNQKGNQTVTEIQARAIIHRSTFMLP